ncbi:MAG TPA: hypothetical protein PKC21_06185 [Oligoflexia bacterium]|nr:hypothetical protein [Oligoflexia bacterium]HMR24923.1 hypothetical protein [Oligoflexia bacterium]
MPIEKIEQFLQYDREFQTQFGSEINYLKSKKRSYIDLLPTHAEMIRKLISFKNDGLDVEIVDRLDAQ